VSAPAAAGGGGRRLAVLKAPSKLPGFESASAAAALAATLAAILLAALAARWLGSRLGALAGLLQLTSVFFLLPVRWGAAEMLFCSGAMVAMGAFALGNVPGRLPLIDRRRTRCAFYAAAGVSFALAGPVGPAFILVGCLLFLICSADSRGLRFLADPLGIALLAGPMVLRLISPAGLQAAWAPIGELSAGAVGPRMSLPEVFGCLALATWPWLPPAVWAVLGGVRRGHYATPLWQFFGCWLLGPLMLIAAGGFRHGAYLLALVPPLAVIGSVGIWETYVACRRRWQTWMIRARPAIRAQALATPKD